MKFVKIDVKNETFLTVGKRLLRGNCCSLDGGSVFLCLLLGHILRKKSVYYIYIYVCMFLLQGLFTFPDEHDKTVY